MHQKDINNLVWLIGHEDKTLKVDDNLYIRRRKATTTYMVRKTIHKKSQATTPGKHPALSLRMAKSEVQKYLDADTSAETVKTLIKDYLTDIVIPDSKLPNQAETIPCCVQYANGLCHPSRYLRVIPVPGDRIQQRMAARMPTLQLVFCD